MFVGEAPGSREDKTGRPFQGDAGRELNRYLESIGVDRERVWVSNIAKCRPLGNRTPTEEEGKFCASIWLEQELELVKPKVIVAMGVVAARYFLGDRFTTMEAGHGRPVEMEVGGKSRVIFPMYHPAAGLRQKRYVGFVKDDFAALGRLLHGGTVEREVVDEWAGKETYTLWDGKLPVYRTLSIDTESLPDGSPYLASVSWEPGVGYVVTRDQFEHFKNTLQYTDAEIVFHNLTYDMKILNGLGIDVPVSRCHDTMLMAHLLQLESRALKQLSHRYCGMSMREYPARP